MPQLRPTPTPSTPPPPAAHESIVAPQQVLTLDALIAQEATAVGLAPDLLRRVIQQESAGNPRAVSPKGARGLGQLMPATAAELGVNPDNPVENVRGAARYLRQQLDAFGGDEAKALAAYNAGPGAVTRYNGVPPYRETQQYVRRIQGGGRGAPPPAAPGSGRRQPTGPGGLTAPPPVPPNTAGPPSAAPSPAAPTPQLQESIVSPQEISLEPPQVAQAGPVPVQGGPPGPPPGIGSAFSPGAALTRLGGSLVAGSLERYAAEALGSGLSTVESGLRTAGGWVADRFRSKEAISDTARVALPIAGGVAGGVLGARGGTTGAMTGAGLGAGAGELAAMGVESVTTGPPTYEEAMSRLKTQAATSAIGEGVAGAAVKAGSKLMAPFKDRLTDAGKQALLKYGKYGPRFTPDQVVEHRGLDVAANIAQGIGGGKYRRFQQATEQMFETEERARLLEQFGGSTTPERAGRVWQTAREAGVERFKQRAAEKYTKVAEAAGEAKIQTGPLIEFAKGELAKRSAVPGEVAGDTGTRLLRSVVGGMEQEAPEAALSVGGRPAQQLVEDPSAQNLVKALREAGVLPEQTTALPKELTYDQAEFFTSELKKLIREKGTGPGKDDRLVGVAKQLLGRMETEIDAGLPEGARVLRREAQDYYRTEKQRLDSKVLRGLARKDPEFIVGAITKPGATTLVKSARDAVSPSAWKQIQASTVKRLLTDEHGNLAAGSDMVKRLNTLTPETMRELFPGGEAAEVIQVARILDQVQRHKEGTGRVWIQLTQAGAVANIAAGGKVGRAARSTVALPWLLSTLLTNGVSRKWLTEGLQAPQGSATAVRASAQAAAWLASQARAQAQASEYKGAWEDGREGEGGPPANPFGGLQPGGAPPPNPFQR